MANDIQKAIGGNPIKNGTLVNHCTTTGKYSVNNNYAVNLPELLSIETKYENRFNHPSYYYGGGGADGGTVNCPELRVVDGGDIV
jgi:hypothetical protein